ncbi:hypothetical protein ACHAQA_008856 [Verticillium albo-atrum]
MLEDIERGSSWLQQQLGQYAPISSDFVTKFCYEEYETPTALGHKLMVVPKVSAVIPGQQDAEQIMIHADHKNMVRFTSATDSNYRIVLELLQLMLRTAAGVVSSRFQNRQETRNDIGDVVSAVKRWLDEPENGRWLLVYDNHDHPKMREGVRGGGKEESNCQHTPLDDHITEQLDNLVVEPFDIKPFLPDTIHGAILVTTRDSRLNLGQSIKLKKLLKLEESLKILETTSNRKNVHTG